jgi:hypothetical protein
MLEKVGGGGRTRRGAWRFKYNTLDAKLLVWFPGTTHLSALLVFQKQSQEATLQLTNAFMRRFFGASNAQRCFHLAQFSDSLVHACNVMRSITAQMFIKRLFSSLWAKVAFGSRAARD